MARVYERKDSKVKWWLDFVADGIRVREPASNSKKIAEQALARRLVDVAEGKFKLAQRGRRMTLGELSERWMTDWGKTRRGSAEPRRTLPADGSRWRMLLELLGDKTPIASLTRDNLSKASQALANRPKARGGGKRSAADCNRHRALLRTALRTADEHDYAVALDALPGWKIRREAEHRDRTIKPGELKRILTGTWKAQTGVGNVLATHETPADLKTIVRIALGTGCRLGEICGLEWPRIDLDARTIHVTQTKTDRSRTIAMSVDAHDALADWRTKYGGEFGARVFSPETKSSNVSSRFRRVCDRLGIEGLRIHDLRHSHATALARGGASWAVVKRQGGWSTDVAAGRYVNPDATDLVAAVDASKPSGTTR